MKKRISILGIYVSIYYLVIILFSLWFSFFSDDPWGFGIFGILGLLVLGLPLLLIESLLMLIDNLILKNAIGLIISLIFSYFIFIEMELLIF